MPPTKLFTPFTIGDIELPNRVLMAPMTRGRADPETYVARSTMTSDYYVARVSSGLIISEGIQTSVQGLGWTAATGIWNDDQKNAWTRIVSSVHASGGRIFAQLWHLGRASHSVFRGDKSPGVAPSAVKISTPPEIHTPHGKKPQEVPHALDISEIPDLVKQFADAARACKEAGFDGVEIHSANGYILDEFLKDGVNKRTDAYGGSVENRARIVFEVIEAIIKVWPSNRVGIRFSPNAPYNDMKDSNPKPLFTHVAKELNKYNLAYVHLVEPKDPNNFLYSAAERISPVFREFYKGPLIANGGYNAETAEEAINNNECDLVSFGVPYIANPDLVERYKAGAALNPAPDGKYFYSNGLEGYLNFPTLKDLATQEKVR